MTVIKASCPLCLDVDLAPEGVRLVVCSVEEWSFYEFRCPTCHDSVTKPASPEAVALLASGGVKVHVWRIPAEALELHDGPRLGVDDLIDFCVALDRDSEQWWAELEEAA